ncbi:FAD/NAD(P)-binding domain-containing protein [Panus rudis PR-1116 ss-1]|nr:FAD/NAD(P)-binding domain-containing protein [Panus rudis PR-1116 ss-1]
MSSDIPSNTRVLVIGGGPAGSYASTVLAREGYDVVLLEMAHFPRYHIGESLIPSVRHYLRFIEAEAKVAEFGFATKPGSAIKFNQFMREGYTDFIALGASNAAWNVTRADFDNILLRHAKSSGVHVHEGTRVTAIHFDHSRDDDEMGRPISASYVTDSGVRGEIAFDYLVDASGRAGVMSTKYLKNRKYNESLKNVAIWGYWRGTGMYGHGTDRENAPFFEALSDESGWAWFIPLHNGLTSVGVVMEQKQLGVRSRACSSACGGPPIPPGEPNPKKTSALADRYLTFLHLAPGVQKLIGEGELVAVDESYGSREPDARDEQESECKANKEACSGSPPMARSASDFSYSASRYAGQGWRIIGDAGAFIDPFFSSGVHLACTGGMAAGVSIAASLRGDCTEREAAAWCNTRVTVSYTRFLVVVLSAYKQIRSQNMNVLADIGDENFDKAFSFLRPVIQGGAEMGAKLSEDEVQRALDFCVNLFNPTTPEQHASVKEKLQSFKLESTRFEPNVRIHGVDDVPCEEGAVQVSSFHIPHEETKSKEEEDEAMDQLMDVRAPVVSPSILTRILRTRFRFRSLSTSAASADVNITPLGSPAPKTRPRAASTMTEPTIEPLSRRPVLAPLIVSSSPAPSPLLPPLPVLSAVPSLVPSSSSTAAAAAAHCFSPHSPPSLNSRPDFDDEYSEHRRDRDRMSTISASSFSSSPLEPATPVTPSFKVRFGDTQPPSSPSERFPDPSARAYFDRERGADGEEEEESEMKMVLDKVNARKVIHAEHGEGLNSLEQEALNGFVVRLVRGSLGFVRVDSANS